MDINKRLLDDLLVRGIREDTAFSGDITSDSIFDQSHISHGKYVAKDNGIFSGQEVLEYIYDEKIRKSNIKMLKKDGEELKKGDIIAEVSGNTRDILLFERISLNIICHICGIANQTKEMVDSMNRDDIRLVDTRKTLPGLRFIQKYAVKTGGGYNHRNGLYDAVMIKDNHIKAAGSISKAVERARQNISHVIKIEVETKELEEVRQAVEAGADIIMLDNMEYEQMRLACAIINKRALIEISGNITKENIAKRVSDLPVDIVSSGSITHSVKVFDISFLFY